MRKMVVVDPETLAAVVCERINRELPSQVNVTPERGRGIAFYREGELLEQLSFAQVFDELPWQKAAESAIWNLLDKLQDFMIEVIAINTWPAQSGFGGDARVSVTDSRI